MMKEVSELHKWLLILRKKNVIITGRQKEEEKKYRKLYTYI